MRGHRDDDHRPRRSTNVGSLIGERRRGLFSSSASLVVSHQSFPDLEKKSASVCPLVSHSSIL